MAEMEFMSVNAAAKFFGEDRQTIQRLIDKHEPAKKKVGKYFQYHLSELAQLLVADRKRLGYLDGFKAGTEAAEADKGGPEQDIDYEKWRETKARADKLELDNAERQKMLAPLEAVIQRDRILANLQATLWESLTVQVKRKRPDVPDELMEAVEEIVSKCRNEYENLIQERMAELEQAMEDRKEFERPG